MQERGKKGIGGWNDSHDSVKTVWSQNTTMQVENSWSTINHAWFEMTARRNTFLKEKNTTEETTVFCSINRINNIKLVVDWWSLQNGKVTWRQASSQSQAWGTLSKLQTGDSSVCNTEEPVYSRVHRSDTHGLQHLETKVEESAEWIQTEQTLPTVCTMSTSQENRKMSICFRSEITNFTILIYFKKKS